MVLVSLECAVVGQGGSSFDVEIDDGAKVSKLKKAIKVKSEDITIPAEDLRLFLAKKDDAWLDGAGVAAVAIDGHGHPQGFEQMDPTLWIKNPKHFGANFQPGEGQVHVVVVVLEGGKRGKRHQSNLWFAKSSHLKKRRVGEERRFFKMSSFPLLAHPMVKYKTIVEREAYAVIFAQLVQHAKSCFEYDHTSAIEPGMQSEPGTDSNVIVTGNPGTGKSRFYLYCIFQLIRCEREDVKQLPPHKLVLNYGDEFLKCDAVSSEFVELTEGDVHALKAKPHVLRLVEATSTKLSGWSGVSVLFASPGVKVLGNFAKVDGLTYIMPAWTLEELEEYNSLLPGDLKLVEDELVSRFDTFGGIPRFDFSQEMGETKSKLKEAIASFSALEIISYCRKNTAVKEENSSHCVLQMVPTKDNFRANFHLDFLSMFITETVIDNVHGESLARVSEFAIVHDSDDSGSTAVIRGKIYELLCHKWFSLHKLRTLHFRSLCSTPLEDATIPKEIQSVRFAALDKLKLAKS